MFDRAHPGTDSTDGDPPNTRRGESGRGDCLVRIQPHEEAPHEHPGAGSSDLPCLLANLAIERPNQVWASDITYLPMSRGFLRPVAILDVASRKVMALRLSNTLTADFCVEALQEAMAQFGAPQIFSTDQGAQLTSDEWIKDLKDAGVPISMDGKSRWIDNVFVERLWRSVKLRGGAPACLRQRNRSQSGADPLPRHLQLPPFSSVPRPPHAGRGEIRCARGNDSGGA
jgi:transposase InsO family protein